MALADSPFMTGLRYTSNSLGGAASLASLLNQGRIAGTLGAGASLADIPFQFMDSSGPATPRALSLARDLSGLASFSSQVPAIRDAFPGFADAAGTAIPGSSIPLLSAAGPALGIGLGAFDLSQGRAQGGVDIATSIPNAAIKFAPNFGVQPGVATGGVNSLTEAAPGAVNSIFPSAGAEIGTGVGELAGPSIASGAEVAGGAAAAGEAAAAGGAASGGEAAAGIAAGTAAAAFAAPAIIGAIARPFLENDRNKDIKNSIHRTQQAQADYGMIVKSLGSVKTDQDFMKVLGTKLPNTDGTVGSVLKTIAGQNLQGDYAAFGWDPDPKLRAAVALFDQLGIPSQAPTPTSKNGGPPANPFEPNIPAYWKLYSLTGIPHGVRGIRLNSANGADLWGKLLSNISDIAIKAHPELATMGPNPVTRPDLNRRLTESGFGNFRATAQENEGRPSGQPMGTADRVKAYLDSTYFSGGGPEHLTQRYKEHYQALTGQAWQAPTSPGPVPESGSA